MHIVVTCNKPNAPAHASILPDVPEVNYNTYITYVCVLGYNRTDGDETRRCTENATFEGVEANCTCMLCITNLTFITCHLCDKLLSKISVLTMISYC